MKEKVFSITGDDFTVKTVDGLDVCKCHGKMVSARDSKSFTDTAGTELFVLKNKMIAISKSFHGQSKNGYSFEIKGHWKMIGSRSTVEFKNASDGSEVELEVKGDWFDRSAEITYAGRPVAILSRSFLNVRQMFGDKQTVSHTCCPQHLSLDMDRLRKQDRSSPLMYCRQYFVTVAPNVDLSLIAAICVSLDEKENDD